MASYGDISDVRIDLPDDTKDLVIYYAIEAIALSFYFLITYVWVHNVVKYIILKKRYKEFSITLFYIFTIGVMLTRIAQKAYSFTVVLDKTIQLLNLVADCFSVIIGLS